LTRERAYVPGRYKSPPPEYTPQKWETDAHKIAELYYALHDNKSIDTLFTMAAANPTHTVTNEQLMQKLTPREIMMGMRKLHKLLKEDFPGLGLPYWKKALLEPVVAEDGRRLRKRKYLGMQYTVTQLFAQIWNGFPHEDESNA
jgi:hypothetical protein